MLLQRRSIIVNFAFSRDGESMVQWLPQAVPGLYGGLHGL